MGSFGISEGNVTGRKTKNLQVTHLAATPSGEEPRRSRLPAASRAEQGSAGCMLRVRTRPEGPEDSLRELT